MNARPFQLESHYDVIIIGGGIYGAAMAWEAASRRLKVLLLEKNDFGGGTSANSMKIIHGGLRYLQSLDIGRTWQSSRERRIFMRIAPHLVSPLRCLMPTRKQWQKSTWVMALGLWLNDVLTLRRNVGMVPEKRIPAGKTLDITGTQALLPIGYTLPYTGAALWCDAQAHNTERLVLAFVLAAEKKSAHVVNYCEVQQIVVDGNKVQGVACQDRLTGQNHQISARYVIHCTGHDQTLLDPWAKIVPAVPYCKGVNIVLNKSLVSIAVGLQTAPVLPNEVSRLLFLVPWKNKTMIGTWYFKNTADTPHAGGAGKAYAGKITAAEKKICLDNLHTVLPGIVTAQDNPVWHRGYLPVHGRAEVDASRDLLQHVHVTEYGSRQGPRGLYRIVGVKYTTARAVACQTINHLSGLQAGGLPTSQSHHLPLYGGDFGSFDALRQRIDALFPATVAQQVKQRLCENYGTTVCAIAELLKQQPEYVKLVPGTPNIIAAEIAYVLQAEYAYQLSDLLLRRMGLGTGLSDETIRFCAQWMAHHYQWTPQEMAQQIEAVYACDDRL